mgnify:CR=1 FL=1
MSDIVEWKPESMLEVKLKEPDDFLKIRETLTRIGVASRKERKIFQSCHILHKQGRYFERRNTISQLLSDWGLIELVGTIETKAPLSQIKVLPYKDKKDWILEPKYNIGKKPEQEGKDNERTNN